MRTLGTVTAVCLSGVAVVVIGLGLRSIPDIKRYLKMRAM